MKVLWTSTQDEMEELYDRLDGSPISHIESQGGCDARWQRDSKRLARTVYATEKSAEMPRHHYDQHREGFNR